MGIEAARKLSYCIGNLDRHHPRHCEAEGRGSPKIATAFGLAMTEWLVIVGPKAVAIAEGPRNDEMGCHCEAEGRGNPEIASLRSQ
jgi:hypothetical protein